MSSPTSSPARVRASPVTEHARQMLRRDGHRRGRSGTHRVARLWMVARLWEPPAACDRRKDELERGMIKRLRKSDRNVSRSGRNHERSWLGIGSEGRDWQPGNLLGHRRRDDYIAVNRQRGFPLRHWPRRCDQTQSIRRCLRLLDRGTNISNPVHPPNKDARSVIHRRR